MSEYVLLKDLPDADKGTKFIKRDDFYFYESKTKLDSWYHPNAIEGNLLWFQEVKPKDERIEVGKMACKEGEHGKWYLQFKTNKHIHYDKAVDLCNVMERHLNGEMNNSAPKPIPIPEYEILSLVTENIGKIDAVGLNEEQIKIHLKYSFHIFSVRRISDSEVFSVGDTHGGISYKEREILGFFIEDGKMMIKQTGGNTGLKFATKAPSRTPLFKDFLGNDVFEGDDVWHVFNDLTPECNAGFKSKWQPNHSKENYSNNCGNEYYNVFKSLESAKEYVLMNKPFISIRELCARLVIPDKSDLIALAKEKLKL